MINAPEGIRINLDIFMTNGDLDAVASLKGLTSLAQLGEDDGDLGLKIMRHVAPSLADDGWRLMTNEEIKDYKQREYEDDDKEGDEA